MSALDPKRHPHQASIARKAAQQERTCGAALRRLFGSGKQDLHLTNALVSKPFLKGALIGVRAQDAASRVNHEAGAVRCPQ
jgi:hypothetical protein